MKVSTHFFGTRVTAFLGILAVLISLCSPIRTTANEWVVDGQTVFATLEVGYSTDGSQYSGTVALRMDPVTVSGVYKIKTTLLSVTPQPGFTAVIRKSGGINGTVEIEFNSKTCQSKFSFLYKPGLTKIDYGVLRCR